MLNALLVLLYKWKQFLFLLVFQHDARAQQQRQRWLSSLPLSLSVFLSGSHSCRREAHGFELL